MKREELATLRGISVEELKKKLDNSDVITLGLKEKQGRKEECLEE